ncbi:MAG: acetoacetate--CoA ligase, partial [Trueperaceae bacterium]|nr:acetoacetate--CoA ligase [Trueperaceae bacterium]
ACSSLGLIFSSCSPDFGYEAAKARFGQIEPKLLFAAHSYYYGGKHFDTLSTVRQLADSIPGIEKVVLFPYPDLSVDVPEGRFVRWEDWLGEDEGLEFASLPFDYPLYILFSSGTTGLPKAIVHRAGGALLKHHSELHLHSDIKAGDRMLYFTTCGWMMWNWLVSGLSQGATIVQFEGSPAYPDLASLWKLSEKQKLSFFGTSARYLHSLQAQGFSAKDAADLGTLKTIASTGSPLSPSGFDYVYSHIKADVHLASISGGTDIVGCFMLGVPTKAVYSGQIQGPAMGVELVALNEAGQSVRNEPGELVIQNPLPSMPLYFWNDPDFERYKQAYLEDYPGKWRHGDLIELTEQGGIIVYGRSDATLNPGGVRIGTAELYRPLEVISEIIEACAIGKKTGQDEEIWLFVVLQEGHTLDEDLEKQIRAEIRSKASPRHVPKRIVQISQLPRTRSGKSMEIAVSRLMNGLTVPNREVMANPEALDELKQLIAK